MAQPVVPESIVVHLGPPGSAAQNVTVPFAEYIKNVASSEIYPTWPESAIRANILAQISFALNRVYTEYYRARGYDYDITSTTQFDQAFVPDRGIFENISQIVDDIFNDYIVRQGRVEPLFAQFCDGVRTKCGGLSQWGSVDLAEEGMTPYEILQYYYGGDIGLVTNAPVGGNVPSYPGRPLRRGSVGEDVRTIERQLNRIGRNYPAIPAITRLDGVFGPETESAVRTFQQIFSLDADGVVGKATWYKIKEIYNGVKKLSELTSEGLTISETERQYESALRPGDSGVGVRTVRYYLAFLGYFLPQLPPIRLTDTFDQEMLDAVYAFQSAYGLPSTGSWDARRGTRCRMPTRARSPSCRRTIRTSPRRSIRGAFSWRATAARRCGSCRSACGTSPARAGASRSSRRTVCSAPRRARPCRRCSASWGWRRQAPSARCSGRRS